MIGLNLRVDFLPYLFSYIIKWSDSSGYDICTYLLPEISRWAWSTSTHNNTLVAHNWRSLANLITLICDLQIKYTCTSEKNDRQSKYKIGEELKPGERKRERGWPNPDPVYSASQSNQCQSQSQTESQSQSQSQSVSAGPKARAKCKSSTALGCPFQTSLPVSPCLLLACVPLWSRVGLTLHFYMHVWTTSTWNSGLNWVAFAFKNTDENSKQTNKLLAQQYEEERGGGEGPMDGSSPKRAVKAGTSRKKMPQRANQRVI